MMQAELVCIDINLPLQERRTARRGIRKRSISELGEIERAAVRPHCFSSGERTKAQTQSDATYAQSKPVEAMRLGM
jgi:hypothetical protein